MKKLTILVATMALLFGSISCGKKEANLLIGTWGVEAIEYYNIDYYGQPIANTIVRYEYPIGDPTAGIDLVFKNSNRGEWHDRDIDTFFVEVSTHPLVYDTIINPDTVQVTTFTYFYDEESSAVFLKTSDARSFMLEVEELNSTTFSYINEWGENSVEHAIMRRISDSKSTSRSNDKRVPRIARPGSLLSPESLDK